MGTRKSNIANRTQHGNWLKRYIKDGVLPCKKRKEKKEQKEIILNIIKPIKSYVTKDFCNHPATLRLSSAVPKVQIEGLKEFIHLAKKEGKNSISISFQITEPTKNWLYHNSFEIIERKEQERENVNGQKILSLLISW